MSLNKDQLTEIIETYIKYINDLKQNEDDSIYWNADIRPTKENWGLTFGACIGDNPRDNAPADNICTSNCFGSGWQCNGFARFVGYLLTGTEIPQQGFEDDPNNYGGGWIRYTDLTNYEFCPGDIVEIHDDKNYHSAIVVSANDDNVSFFEVWGGKKYGCKIEYGVFNGGAFYDPNATHYVEIPTTATNLRLYANHVIKCPPIEEGTPAPKPDKYIVNTRFYLNYPDKEDEVHTGTAYAYTLGDEFGSLPTAPTREGYNFIGWFTDRTGGTQVTTDSVVSWDKNALYAQWTEDVETVTVSFYDDLPENDGKYIEDREYVVKSSYSSQYDDSDDTFPDPADFPKTGYKFDHWWFEGETGYGYVETDTEVTRDITDLYAHWTANTYDVTLNKNDGTNVSETESFVFGGTYGEKLGTLEDRYGYTFKEWNTSPDGEGDSYNENSLIEAKNLDLYAIWEEKEVKVTYNYGYEVNGTVKTGEGTLNYGDTYAEAAGTNVPNMTDLEHPTGGYEFAGWHHEVVEGSDTVVMDADHTLTAMWEPKEYTVSFVAGDSEFASNIPEKTVKYGQKYGCLPTPKSKDLYEFSHWEYCGEKCESSTEVLATGDHILTAHWNNVCLYNVYYEDSNGKSRKVSNTVNYGEPYVVPALTEKIGYNAKWAFSEEGSPYNGAQFFPGMLAIPEHPNTIKAVYTAKLINVTYDYCGGQDWDGNTNNCINSPYNYYYGFSTLTRPGYTFTGWYYDAECTQPIGENDVITNPEAHTVYAGWKKNITLTFDPGDSTFAETVEPKTVYFGEPYGDLPVPKSADNYLFYCWVEANENGDIIDSEKVVDNEQDHTAVAIWSTFRHLILDPNGGTCSIGMRSVTFGNMYPILPTPTREGYTFDGWYFLNEDGSFGTKCERKEELIVLPEHPDTVYAKWIPVNVTVTFNGMGGTPAFSSYVHSYGSNYALPYAIRTGYTFNGWFFDENCTEQCTVDNIVTNAEDHTLYAGWSIDEDENSIE